MIEQSERIKHDLTDVNHIARTGVCIICGETKVRKHGKFADGGQRWKCQNAYDQSRNPFKPKRHILTVQKADGSGECEQCGTVILGKAGFRHGVQWYRCPNAIKKHAIKPKGLIGKREHLLSEIDVEKKVGTCAKCGPGIPILSGGMYKGETSWKCAKACRARAKNRDPEDTRWQKVKFHYGITKEKYATMLDKQGGKCAICRRFPGKQHLQIDHNHTTGAVRGLLCRTCNAGLGQFFDDQAILQSAILYLGFYDQPQTKAAA
jgi:hypothetical protein